MQLVKDQQPSNAPYCYRLPRKDAGCTNLGHMPTRGLPCVECSKPKRDRIDGV